MTALLAVLGNWRTVAAIALVGALGAGWLYVGHLRSEAAVQRALAAQHKATAESYARDLAASRDAEAAAAVETETVRAAFAAAAQEVRDYEAYLATRPARACALGADDVERLRRVD